MEVLGERPVWSMSDSEQLSALDEVVAEEARLRTLRLHLIASIDQSGYAQELGAGDTARLLSQRYRIDAPEARREARLATRLTRYAATSAALPDPNTPFANPATASSAASISADPAADSGAGDETEPAEPAESAISPTSGAWRVHPTKAAAIVAVLDQVPTTVPIENLEFAEQQLIELAATCTPTELRSAGRKIRDILDPDGPEPQEKEAYARESLTMKTVDRGLTFRGYLANENAELFRTLIHANAKPHKTNDGELDPRPHDKRQADALTTVLNSAANARDMADSSRRPLQHPNKPVQPILPVQPIQHPGPSSHGGYGGDGELVEPAPPAPPVSPPPAQPIRHPEPSSHGGYDGHGEPVQPIQHTESVHDSEYGESLQQLKTVVSAVSESGITVGQTNDLPASADGDALIPLEATADSGADGNRSDDGSDGDGNDGNGSDDDGGVDVDFVPGHGPKAHISVTIDFKDLAAATANATGALVFGDNLSAATVRRLACDAEILPIVLGSKSQPLDVGTSQRLITRPMRRALNARDKGCVVCGAPPIQCEAHHVVSWLDGGPTAVTNLALLCKRHHLDLHSGHWLIRILDGVVRVTRPAWTTPTRIPRGKYKPASAEIIHQPIASPPNPWGEDERSTERRTRASVSSAHPQQADPWGEAEPGLRTTKRPLSASVTSAHPRLADPWGDDQHAAPRDRSRPPSPAASESPAH